MTDGASGSLDPSGDDRLILLLVGAAGAGKGTQAEILSRQLGIPHLASGDLFRAAVAAGTPLGEIARAYMDRGELVPDDTTIAMFMERLAEPSAQAGAILDGFPRTVAQADALDATLGEQGERVALVIYIDVPKEELIRRLAGRWVCPTCGTTFHEVSDRPREEGRCDNDGDTLIQRDDDRPEVVRARLEQQIPPMLEVIDHYEALGVVERVDGSPGIEAVTAEILGRIDRVGVTE